MENSLLFDHAELVLTEDSNLVTVIAYARGGATEAAITSGDRRGYSPRLWPTPGDSPLYISDATAELDRKCHADRRLADAGARSLLIIALPPADGSHGILILSRARIEAFDASQVAMLLPVSEFLSAAAERERLWELEETRHRRRMKFEALVPTIAESLDIRKVFLALSAVIREVVPHDVLAFSLISADRGGVRVQAATQQRVIELPEYRFSNQDEALDANWNFLLAYDLTPLDGSSVRARISPRRAPQLLEVVVSPGPAWMRFITEAQIRSTLRVAIRSKGRPIGGIAFMSRQPDAYDEEDGMLASRISDLVALSLAHQELAEEERQMALAEERAQLLERRVDALSRELERFSAHRAIGTSAAWKQVLALATQVADTDTTVLLLGESGTGKEVIARYLHRGSKREKGPFVALNCAALPEQLMESELFGRERGAYTGAVDSRAGKIEQATGGVLFLDEVAEMSPSVQAKFLRVLQEREFQRVGGSRTIKVDVRIVAATNRDLRAAIEKGAFREDLYYRLCVFEIHLPPLRQRPEDILVLAEAFLEEVGQSIGRPAAGISEDAREQLQVHSWPGNVRELRNAIERAVITCRGGLITREHLPITVARPSAERVALAARPAEEFSVEGVPLEMMEKDFIQKAMAKAGNNKSQAAKLLGLSRGQLYSLLRRHGLTDARR